VGFPVVTSMLNCLFVCLFVLSLWSPVFGPEVVTWSELDQSLVLASSYLKPISIEVSPSLGINSEI
jgi:hypothetical protein